MTSLVPSLDELAADPRKAATLSPDAARAVTMRCAAVLAAVASVSTPLAPQPRDDDEDGLLLTTEEAAQRLGVSQDWLYRRAATLPFTVRLGRSLRFSIRGLERYIRQREGR
jgi:excisionase family DNA binding protein